MCLLSLPATAGAFEPLTDVHVKFQRDQTSGNHGEPATQVRDCRSPLDPAAPPQDGPAVSAGGVSGKIDGRGFPSVFQAWETASNLGKEDSFARHDLAWTGLTSYGLKGNSRWAGLSTAFTGGGRQASLRGGNTNLVLLAEIRWKDGRFEDGDDPAKQYLPKGHPWWLQKDGAMVPANTTLTAPYFLLDYRDPCFQEQVARQCKAAIATGLFDGCMLDWWHNADSDQLAMLRKVREAIGSGGLIIVNANGDAPTASFPYINGVFTEGFGASFWRGGQGYAQVPYPKPEAWQNLIALLQTLETSATPPRINAIEGWGDAGDAPYLRSLTTLVLAYSKAYVLYSRPNKTVPNHDHTHPWDPFWDKGLGAPRSDGAPVALPGGAVRREFSGGTVVYNPSENAVLLSFPEPRTSRATGVKTSRHQVPPHDGDIFVP